MESAAGILGSPGIVIIAPLITTTNPAPLDNRTSLIGRVCPGGAPFNFGSVEKLYCVFAIHTGNLANPDFSIIFTCSLTLSSNSIELAP